VASRAASGALAFERLPRARPALIGVLSCFVTLAVPVARPRPIISPYDRTRRLLEL